MAGKGRCNATADCEAVLIADKNYNLENGIYPKHNRLIDSILGRSAELEVAYLELHQKLAGNKRSLRVFFCLLLDAAIIWNPKRAVAARADRQKLTELNEKISAVAWELHWLLKERGRMNNTSAFYSSTLYHPLDVVEKASDGNSLYSVYVAPALDGIRSRFDLKYWPSLEDCVAEIARDADGSEVEASHSATAAATKGPRSSLADFLHAFDDIIKDAKTGREGGLPGEFALTDDTMASFINVVLDIDRDKMVDSTFVKGFRQRRRNAGSRDSDGSVK